MSAHVLILSKDAVFARMLELECVGMGLSARVASEWNAEGVSDLILWDLDAVPPTTTDSCSVPVIGYTKQFELSHVDTERLCSMILHRPFEMRMLRREIKTLLSVDTLSYPSKEIISLQKDTLRLEKGSVTLSPKEALIMQCLLESRPDPVPYDRLADLIGESRTNKVEVYICYLRKKTEEICDRRIIRTVRGVGYALA